jgi:hypothetical protein
VHRVDLHNELKILALSPRQGTITPELYLSAKVDGIDPETGIVRLQNGETHQGDLIIGADGVHVGLPCTSNIRSWFADMGSVCKQRNSLWCR